MSNETALKKILAEERERTDKESIMSPLDFRKKYGTFNSEEVAIMAAMKRAFQLGEES